MVGVSTPRGLWQKSEFGNFNYPLSKKEKNTIFLSNLQIYDFHEFTKNRVNKAK